jgi:hypothetical protein
MMISGRGIALSVLALLVSTPAAQAEPAGPTQVAVGGLRPTKKPNYKETALEQLPQAQELRAVVDEVVRDITGRPVLNHAALRAAIGSSYLVTMFECGGEPGCIARAFSGIKGRARLVVYGDYTARRKKYLFRLRVVDLESRQMVAEHEFSISGDGKDREDWKRELKTLFEPLQLEREEDAEAGGKREQPDAEAGGKREHPEGEAGGKREHPDAEAGGKREHPDAEAGGEREHPDAEAGGKREQVADAGSEGAQAGADADELTDADFGVEATDAAIRPVEQRRPEYWFQLRAEAGVLWRRFFFDAEPDEEESRPDGFKGTATPTVSGALDVYPLARATDGLLGGFGLFGSYARSTAEASATSAQAERIHVGASYRLLIGTSDTLPTLRVTAGYLHNKIDIDDPLSYVPDVSYQAATFGADVTMPITTPRFALRAGARYLLVTDAGDITSSMRYGDSRTRGIEFEGGLDLRLGDLLFISVGGAYGGVAYDFKGNGALSGPGTAGARDKVTTATVATGLLL